MSSELFYWNNKKGQEVDIVFDLFGKRVPIEVMYWKDIKSADLSGLYSFKEEYDTEINLVVTQDTLSLDDGIIKVPLWVFLFNGVF